MQKSILNALKPKMVLYSALPNPFLSKSQSSHPFSFLLQMVLFPDGTQAVGSSDLVLIVCLFNLETLCRVLKS